MADTLNIDGGVVGAAIAADNVIVALYFAFLFYLATPGSSIGPNTTLQNNDNKLDEEIDIPGETAYRYMDHTRALLRIHTRELYT